MRDERIWALVDIISTGQMPAGHTAEDLRAMGLPQPGELYREEQPDGTILIRQVAPSSCEEDRTEEHIRLRSPDANDRTDIADARAGARPSAQERDHRRSN